MRFEIATACIIAGFLMVTPAMAAPLLVQQGQVGVKNDIIDVQYTAGSGREFRRCMRAKYGPRYFSRVPRAHRFHMARACGG